MDLKSFVRKIISRFAERKREKLSKVTKEDIKNALKKIGIKEGDTLFVHSSSSKLGYAEGGINAIIDAFIETIGKEGTLVMPTFNIIGSSREFLKKNPLF